MRAFLLLATFCIVTTAQAGPVSSFDDIQFWIGAGSNRAAMVIDWEGENSNSQSLAWGYRWDGAATGVDMAMAIISADPRLFVKVQSLSGGLGMAIYAFGYDNGDGIFTLNDGTVFDSTGVANTPPADAAHSLDPADLYAEGAFTGFWHYGVSTGNPYDGGSWASSNWGASSRELVDGDWDGWAFTPNFDFSSFPSNPQAAIPVPEPTTFVLLLAASPLGLYIARRRRVAVSLVLVAAMTAAGSTQASPFATEVVSYTPGNPIGVANPAPFQTDGTQALGSPSRDTLFGSQVGVFYPVFGSDELVIVGAGGELTVKFDNPVENDPLNPFGIDLLIFSNTFFARNPATGATTGMFGELGQVAVSQDGILWHMVPNAVADSTLYPTLGYIDTVYNGMGNYGGTIPTDFTKPVDPSFDPIGLTEAEIAAGYNGSGGGTGIDIGLANLDWIQYVRVFQETGASWSMKIDAFADVAPIPVPEPSTLLLAAVAGCGFLLRARNKS